MNHLLACIGKVGCAPFVGGNFDSMAFSPSTVGLSDHIIGEARKLARGFALDQASVNLSEIHRVGHGGNYFTSEGTIASLDELKHERSIWPALSLNEWKEQHMPTAEKELIDYSIDLYGKAMRASGDAGELIEKGEHIIERFFSA